MTKLKPFQVEGVRQIYRFRGKALLCDEMGLGKTIQALRWIQKIPKHRPVVIITPASVKYVWQAEASLHFDMRVEVIEGRRKRQRKLPGDIVVINYELLKSWLPVLKAAKPQVVVMDEIHYIKNWKAQRTVAATAVTEGAKSRLGLSGTPLTNRPIELWAVLRAVRPDLFPSLTKFAWKYCKPRYTPWGWVYDGAANLHKLRKILLRECLIRRLKKDVLKELPKKSRRVVPLRLPNTREYEKASTNFIKWLREISPSRAVRAKRSEALTKVGYLLRLVADLKKEAVAQWIEEFLTNHPEEKLVCFTMHTAVIDFLRKRFPRSVFVDGRVVGRLRQEAVRQFQSNRIIRLMFGNWKAAGVGLTMTAASNVAALDFPWTPGDLLQGEDRVHRIGQKLRVVIHYLAALGTIEEKQINVLIKKSGILDAVLDGRRSASDLDIFEELMKEVNREVQATLN